MPDEAILRERQRCAASFCYYCGGNSENLPFEHYETSVHESGTGDYYHAGTDWKGSPSKKYCLATSLWQHAALRDAQEKEQPSNEL